jgi:hypothetical protein
MEGCPLRVRRRAAFQPRVGHSGQVLVQLVDEPRLPDPCLAEDEDVLPLAVLRPLPAIDECRQLDFAPDEAGQASRRDVEPATYPARPHDAVERHRLAHALQHLRPAVLDHEQPGHQALRRTRDHHRVGLGCTLHARCNVRRLAEDLAAVRNHHRPGVHPNPHRETRPLVGSEGGIEGRHRLHNCEASADSPFRVILARGGPAEVDEQPIAESLGNVVAEAGHGSGGGLLVLRDDIAPLLGIEVRAELGRADEVAEEHRQLAPLADFGGAGCRLYQFSWSRGLAEGCATLAAELRLGLQLVATARTQAGQGCAARLTEA